MANGHYRQCRGRLIDWNLQRNGTFSTNRLHRAFEKFVGDKKIKINEKVDNVRCWKYAKWNHYILNKRLFSLVFVGETRRLVTVIFSVNL